MFQLHQLKHQRTKTPEFNGGIVPLDPPMVEIPEFEGGIPGIPEVRELPEYTEPIGTVPNEAPVHDKPRVPRWYPWYSRRT